MKILVLNSGSSTQKSALFELEENSSADAVSPLWEGKLDWDGSEETLTIRNAQGKKIHAEADTQVDERQASVEKTLRNLWSGPTAVLSEASDIDVVGHRIVHGGPELTQPSVVDSKVKQAIAAVSAIAPLHNKP